MIIDRYAVFSLNIEGISKKLQKYENQVMKRYGMRSSHALCIYKLGRSTDGMTVTELASACELDKAFVSRIVSELLANGCACYEYENAGKYRNRILLTEKGREITNEIDSIIDRTLKSLGSKFTKKELAVFYRVLKTLNTDIGLLSEYDEKKGEIV